MWKVSFNLKLTVVSSLFALMLKSVGLYEYISLLIPLTSSFQLGALRNKTAISSHGHTPLPIFSVLVIEGLQSLAHRLHRHLVLRETARAFPSVVLLYLPSSM